MIVTDPGFLRTGLVDAPARDLEKHDMAVEVYSDVMADPPEQIVLTAVEFARKHAIDIVIGIGGGSSMDVAKLIAVLAGSEPASARSTASATSAASDCRWCRCRPPPAPVRK